MKVQLLAGRRAGEIAEMPFHHAQKAIASGTVLRIVEPEIKSDGSAARVGKRRGK